jgi:hypothetical protein
MARTPMPGSGLLLFCGRSGWSAGALVVPGAVDGEPAEGVAGGGVDDAHVPVPDEPHDVGVRPGSGRREVVQGPPRRRRDAAGLSTVSVRTRSSVSRRRPVSRPAPGRAVQAVVRAVVVAGVAEAVERGLPLGDWCDAQPAQFLLRAHHRRLTLSEPRSLTTGSSGSIAARRSRGYAGRAARGRASRLLATRGLDHMLAPESAEG